jgi:hypothetical protein
VTKPLTESSEVAIDGNIDAQPVTIGNDTVYMRFRDISGRWSVP